MIGLLIRLILLIFISSLIYRFLRMLLAPRRDFSDFSSSRKGQQADLEDPYKILGIVPSASEEEIKAAYKAALKKYHPDNVAHLGIELQDLARSKTVEIIKAYERLSQKK